jgi:hypothetical protein
MYFLLEGLCISVLQEMFDTIFLFETYTLSYRFSISYVLVRLVQLHVFVIYTLHENRMVNCVKYEI